MPSKQTMVNNIRFAAVKVWNHLDESINHLPLKKFKDKVKQNILQSYSL